jgi:sec-independent protein translocase protein TatB
MFDIGMTEMLVVGVVALIVVGPKDLPVMFRRVGQFVGKAKGMAREFSSAMNDAADESGVREMSAGINKSLKAASNPIGSAMDGVKSAASSITNLDPESETGKLSAKRAEDVKRRDGEIDEAHSVRVEALEGRVDLSVEQPLKVLLVSDAIKVSADVPLGLRADMHSRHRHFSPPFVFRLSELRPLACRVRSA